MGVSSWQAGAGPGVEVWLNSRRGTRYLPLHCLLHPHCPQVPFRRVQLTGGSGLFDVYDTSGPQVCKEPNSRCFVCFVCVCVW